MKNKIRLLLAQKTVVVMLLASLLVVGTVSAAVVKGVALIRQAQEIANTPTNSSSPAASSQAGSTATTPSSQDSNKTSSTPNTNSGTKTGTPQTQTKTQTSSGSTQTSGGTTTTPSTPATPPSSGGFQANCINVPSACGYPDASNTGVPAGVTLTNSGSITVTQDGAVVQNLLVNGQIIIQANNVTIKNTRIISGDYYPIAYDRTGLLVQDSEIIGTNGDVTAGMSFDSYTARRVEITGTSDGFKANDNVLIEDSYVHDLAITSTSHNDGVQTTGGSNVTLRHNTFKLGSQDVSSVLQLGTEWGSNSNWTIASNLIDGGGWTFNNGNQIPGSSVTNNRFTRRYAYGIGWIADSAVWTGNIYDDNGAVAPQT